jgi:hypothetical protein
MEISGHCDLSDLPRADDPDNRIAGKEFRDRGSFSFSVDHGSLVP